MSWRNIGLIGQLQSRAAEARAALGVASAWNHTQEFSLVEGQTDYLFEPGGDADTDATKALVQWGVTILPPSDYEILADRVRLSAAPSATDASLGQPLTVRVSRA